MLEHAGRLGEGRDAGSGVAPRPPRRRRGCSSTTWSYRNSWLACHGTSASRCSYTSSASAHPAAADVDPGALAEVDALDRRRPDRRRRRSVHRLQHAGPDGASGRLRCWRAPLASHDPGGPWPHTTSSSEGAPSSTAPARRRARPTSPSPTASSPRSGRVDGRGREEIDADGALVTPGFVDIHTHYDGQATWDEQLTPSCWHGVTTVVMGNCGVGFAPVAPDRHEWLIGLMEGVEDIPGAALSAGIQWGWETFPEFLDALDAARPRDGPRHAGAPRRRARLRDGRARRAQRARHRRRHRGHGRHRARQASRPARSGFSTSRTLAHRAIDGEPVPGTFAAEDELFGIGRVLGELGTGVFELAPAGALGEDLAAPEREMDWMRRLSAAIERPGHVRPDPEQQPTRPRGSACSTCRRRRPPRACRCDPRCTAAPCRCCSASRRSTRSPSPRRGATPASACSRGRSRSPASTADPDLARPDRRRRRAASRTTRSSPGFMHPSRIYVLGDPPVYEPGPERSATAIAAARGVDEWELLLDLFLERRRPRAAQRAGPQLHRRQPRRRRRDAPAPHVRLRPRRRRRPRRADVRRVHHHLPPHRTGRATATTAGSPSRRPCTR